MESAIGACVIGFLIGLSGALAPGPTLIATIQGSLRDGWRAGPLVSAGHAVIEAGVVMVIILGVSTAAETIAGPIALLGGGVLILFGLMTLRESRQAELTLSATGAAGNPCVAGALTSAANPYFWLWWLTIGSSLVLEAVIAGPLVLIAFMAGHWAADAGWFSIVALGCARGKSVLGTGQYRFLLALCGIFLMLFGAYYLIGSFPLR